MLVAHLPATGEVTVLTNWLNEPVSVSIERLGEPASRVRLQPSESVPVFFSGLLRVGFDSMGQRHTVALQPYAAYGFGMRLEDGATVLQQIGLGETGARVTPPEGAAALADAEPFALPVKILVDDDEPTHRDIWEDRLRERVAKASEVLEKHAGVGLRVAAVETWDSNDARHDFGFTMREFEREVRPGPARLAIGFSSQYRIEYGRHHMGGTRGPLHPYILLKERSPNVLEPERLELLVHELGHYLGAAHSPEPWSVMRPVLRAGQQRAAGSQIRFDPVNTLLVAMVGEQLRAGGLRALSRLPLDTKRRMSEIYGALALALPEDPAASQLKKLLDRTGGGPTMSDNNAQQILTQLVEEAKELQSKSVESALAEGDQRTKHFVRRAARVAGAMGDSDGVRRAMLIALGVFFDDTLTLAKNPLTKPLADRLESPERRLQRMELVGFVTMRGRNDLAKHFFLSALLTAAVGPEQALQIGLAKENADARSGSGFSFADLAADTAGVRFAEGVLDGSLPLEELADGFAVDRFLPEVEGLREGLRLSELRRLYPDAALQNELAKIEKMVESLPAYEEQ